MSKPKLSVAFEFPGAPDAMIIHLDRIVGTGDNTNDRRQYTMAPELEITLSAIPGLILDSNLAKVQKYSIQVEFGPAFDTDELCKNIATALGEYFGVESDNIQVKTVLDHRPLRARPHG